MGVYTGTLPGAFTVERLKASEIEEMRLALDALTSAWTVWSPTHTNLTVGNGTVTARYRQMGKTVDYYWEFLFGSSGSAVGTSPQFTVPATMASHYGTGFALPGSGYLLDAGTASRPGGCSTISTTTVEVINLASGVWAQTTATAPWTWANGDRMRVWGTYEAA